jgi:hypothetical protein
VQHVVAQPGDESFRVSPEGTAQDNTQALPQRLIDIDEDYLTLLDIPVVAGRNFTTRRQPTPGEGRYSVKEVLINEAMVRKMAGDPIPGWPSASRSARERQMMNHRAKNRRRNPGFSFPITAQTD